MCYIAAQQWGEKPAVTVYFGALIDVMLQNVINVPFLLGRSGSVCACVRVGSPLQKAT